MSPSLAVRRGGQRKIIEIMPADPSKPSEPSTWPGVMTDLVPTIRFSLATYWPLFVGKTVFYCKVEQNWILYIALYINRLRVFVHLLNLAVDGSGPKGRGFKSRRPDHL